MKNEKNISTELFIILFIVWEQIEWKILFVI